MLAFVRRLLPGSADGGDVEPATGKEARKLKHRKRRLRRRIKDLEKVVDGSCGGSCAKRPVPKGALAASKQLKELRAEMRRIDERLEAGGALED